MNKTIRKQLFLSVSGIIFVIIIINIIFSTFFLEKIYINKQKTELESIYNLIKDKNLSEGDLRDLYKECLIKNIKLMMTDENFEPIYYTIDKNKFSDEKDFVGHIQDFKEKPMNIEKLIEKTSEYSIVQIEENRTNLKHLELRTDGNSNILIRISLDNIQGTISIYNKINFIVLIIGLLIGIILSYLLSNKISKPIKNLTEISENMIKLNFNTKYINKANNEIDVLGDNFNELSNKLDNTLTDLKNANEELEKDIKILEKVDEKRKEFISNVSHELKTPITLIEGYAEALKDGISDNTEDNEDYCNIIIDESNKMNKIVGQLIELIKMEEVSPELTEFNIVDLTKNLIDSYNKDDINIALNIKCNPIITSDEFRIERTITNYLTNAIDHCDADKFICITITRKDNILRYEVFNKGSQIPEEEMESIWERFYKIDKSRTRQYGGTGIGLSIVKENIKSLNGSVGLKNELDGVSFFFEIPVQ